MGYEPDDAGNFLETHKDLGDKSRPKNQDIGFWLSWESKACKDDAHKVSGFTFKLCFFKDKIVIKFFVGTNVSFFIVVVVFGVIM